MEGKNPLVVVLLVVNALGLGAVAYFQFQFFQKESEKPTVRELVQQHLDESGSKESRKELVQTKKEEGKLMSLAGFTANLAQGDGPRRYLRLKTVLKFNSNANEEEFNARKPQIRDAIISIINSKRPQDLLAKEGKTYLKEEIKSAINAFMVNGNVIDVFYVSFQIN